MTQSAHTFTPKDDSLAERLNAYRQVKRDFDDLQKNRKQFDQATLGEKEDVAAAQKILQNSLGMAFQAIQVKELQNAVQQGLISQQEMTSFIQAKNLQEMEERREKSQSRQDSHERSCKL